MQLLTIAGNAGKDAVLRRTGSGDPVLSFSIAVDNGKDKDGKKRESTWFDCSIWGKRAESLERHITKGSKLVLSGRPSARAHEGKAYIGINVQELTFMGGGQSSSDTDQSHASQASEGYGAPATSGAGGAPADMDDSEIPF